MEAWLAHPDEHKQLILRETPRCWGLRYCFLCTLVYTMVEGQKGTYRKASKQASKQLILGKTPQGVGGYCVCVHTTVHIYVPYPIEVFHYVGGCKNGILWSTSREDLNVTCA
jgi:hypothetical protein